MQVLGFGICKTGYIRHKYAILAGMLGMKIKLLISHYLPFVDREGILGLTIQPHLGWSSHTLLQYWVSSLMSRHKLLSRSIGAREEKSALSVKTRICAA